MNKSQGISCRISKVNQQLQKLAGLIQNDRNQYSRTRQALKQFNQSESSEDSFNYFELENQLARSKGFNRDKIQVVSNFSDQMESNDHGSTAKSGIMGIGGLKQSKMEDQIQQQVQHTQGNQPKTADITVKKFRPVYNQSKKKKQSQEKIKQNSKLKNSKSQNKIFMSSKTQTMKKRTKKVQKQVKKVSHPYHLTTQVKGVYKKMKTSQNVKTNSQNRLNQSLKMHINLKKQVNMKITDLNIQKQQCQKQAQYLKLVMKVQQQQRLDSIIEYIGKSSQESIIMVFMGRLLVNFFSQFFHQKIIISGQCTCEQLSLVLNKTNYLIKYMLKLPDIIKKDNTLCEQRCKKLFEQKYFIDHRIQNSYKNIQLDILYIFIDNLHDYISFLINNNVVKQTKRKMLPIQFHSQRSGRSGRNYNNMVGINMNNNMNNNNMNNNSHIGHNSHNINLTLNMANSGIISKQKDNKDNRDNKDKQRQYDSDRKGRKQLIKINNYHNTGLSNNSHKSVNTNSRPTLKRTNTMKILSPKAKINKIYANKDKDNRDK